MKKIFLNMNLNRRLAIVILTLAFLAIFAGSPYKGNHVTLDSKELALIVEGKLDHVSAEDLADWIIKGKSDYRLIDLRSEKEFNEYHIPGAENVPLANLNSYSLKRNEKIIIYSEGGIHSAQAWFLLKAEDFKGVYMLFGGLDEWKDKILFPQIPENPSPGEITSYEKTKEVSKYFGGQPQTRGKTESSKLNVPKLELPSPSTIVPMTGEKKKKEGC